MYSGFSGWLISPHHTSPQEVEMIVPGPTEKQYGSLKEGKRHAVCLSSATLEGESVAIQWQHLARPHFGGHQWASDPQGPHNKSSVGKQKTIKYKCSLLLALLCDFYTIWVIELLLHPRKVTPESCWNNCIPGWGAKWCWKSDLEGLHPKRHQCGY